MFTQCAVYHHFYSWISKKIVSENSNLKGHSMTSCMPFNAQTKQQILVTDYTEYGKASLDTT
jgi:hypothetical protein